MGSGMAPTLLSVIFVTTQLSPPVSVASMTTRVNPNNANVTQAVVFTNLGQNSEIFCFVPEEAVDSLPPEVDRLCRYYHIDDIENTRNIVVNVTNGHLISQDGPGVYEYFGTGVKEGQCGLRILSVTEEQIGRWTCAFHAGQNMWRAEIEVLKYEKPEPPTMMVDGYSTEIINVTDWQNETIVQQNSTILCCSIGGKPISDTKLGIYLDEQSVPDIVLKKNDSSSTCIQWVETFTKHYNGKILSCRVTHPGLSEESEYSLNVNVEYSPEIVDRKHFITRRVYSKDNTEVDLHFTVRGNPIPNVVIKRNVTMIDPDSEMEQVRLEEIHVKNVQVHSERNRENFIVTIDAPTEADGSITYEFLIENYLGFDIGVTIVTPPNDDIGTTVWILIIVGVVMFLIFIGIILYFLNKKAKNRGWCGYEARVEKYKVKMMNNSADHINNSPNDNEYSSVADMQDSRF